MPAFASVLIRAWWIAAVALCGVNVAQAAAPAWVADCAAVDDDAARLACYDARNPPKKNTARAQNPAPVTAPVPSTAATSTAAPAPTGASPPAPAHAQVSTPAPAADFGLPPQRDPAEKSAEPNLIAHVEAASQRLTGEWLLKLDNGQSWIQAQRKSTVIIKAGERVTIARGSFGGYLLSSDSGATMRVRRLQ